MQYHFLLDQGLPDHGNSTIDSHAGLVISVGCLPLQEYYLLALAQPRRDSKALGDGTLHTPLAKSASSAFRPSFLRGASSVVKSEPTEVRQAGLGSKQGSTALQLSADSSTVQRSGSQVAASSPPINIGVEHQSRPVGPALAAEAAHQGSVMQDTTADPAPKQHMQAAAAEEAEHQHDQVYRSSWSSKGTQHSERFPHGLA